MCDSNIIVDSYCGLSHRSQRVFSINDDVVVHLRPVAFLVCMLGKKDFVDIEDCSTFLFRQVKLFEDALWRSRVFFFAEVFGWLDYSDLLLSNSELKVECPKL